MNFDLLTHIAKMCFTNRGTENHRLSEKLRIYGIVEHFLNVFYLLGFIIITVCFYYRPYFVWSKSIRFCQRISQPTVSKSSPSTDRSGNRMSENIYEQNDSQERQRV